MKKIILAGLVLMASVACNTDKIKPSGNVVTENREINGYWYSLMVRDGLRAEAVLSDETSLSVTADDNILPYIETRVESGTLLLKVKDNTSFRGNPTIRINISADRSGELSRIGSIMCTDGSALTVKDPIPHLLSVGMSGGSRCTADATAVNLVVYLSDGSQFKGDIQPMEDPANPGSVDPDGYMKAELADGSKAELTGAIPSIEIKCSDGSRLSGYGFAADKVTEATLSDGSKVEMTVNDVIEKITASDGSKFHYKGNAEVWTKTLSDGSELKKVN